MAAASTWLAVAMGGALGSLARYAIGLSMASLAVAVPLATLTVNVVGGLVIGLVSGVAAQRPGFPEALRLGLTTGLMGGFTTFSAFSLETMRLFERALPGAALLNIGLNVALSLAACALGLWLARSIG